MACCILLMPRRVMRHVVVMVEVVRVIVHDVVVMMLLLILLLLLLLLSLLLLLRMIGHAPERARRMLLRDIMSVAGSKVTRRLRRRPRHINMQHVHRVRALREERSDLNLVRG